MLVNLVLIKICQEVGGKSGGGDREGLKRDNAKDLYLQEGKKSQAQIKWWTIE